MMVLIVMANTIVLALNGLLGDLPPVDALVHDMTPYLATLASWSSVMGVILALLVGLILLFLNRRGHAYRWPVSGRALTTSFVVVLLSGFVVYDVGMYISHEPLSLLTNVPMAITSAVEGSLPSRANLNIPTPIPNTTMPSSITRMRRGMFFCFKSCKKITCPIALPRHDTAFAAIWQAKNLLKNA